MQLTLMGQRILKYSTATIVSLLGFLLMGCLPLQAQQQPTKVPRGTPQKVAKQKPVEVDTIPFYNGTYIGVDVFGIGNKLFGGDYLSTEVDVRVNLKNKYIPTVEIGYGRADAWSDHGIHYKNSAPYFRIGADYNVMAKKKEKNSYLYAGLRYGMSSFKYDVASMPFNDPIYGGSLANPSLPDDIWGGSVPYDYRNLKATMHWAEIVAGIHVKIYKSFYMGWALRMKWKISASVSEHGNPWYVPGFGEYDSSNLGVTYTLIYKLPY